MDKYDYTVTSTTYADAETRGRLRQWKKKLARDYAQFSAAYANKRELTPVIVNMIKKGKEGRLRAFEKLVKALGPGLIMESVKLEQGKALAIWAILKPRSSVLLDAPDAYLQDCVTVNYVVAGAHRGEAIIAEGLWTLEVPDHALGRAVERSGFLHPGKIIHDAHRVLLDLPLTNRDNQAPPSKYLKAGNGCFVGELVLAIDASLGYEPAWHIRVKTWLENDMLGPDQIPSCEKATPGNRLGDTIFLPRPLIVD